MFELARKFIILFSSKLTGKRETEQGLKDLESAAKKLEKSTSGLSEQQKKLGEVSAEAGKKQSIYANMMKRLEFQHKAVTRLLGENTRCIAKNITVTRDGYRVTTTYTNGMKVLNRTMTFTKDGFKKVGTSIRDIGERLETSTPLMEQFVMALKRVAIVVPVWWTARQVMMNFINTIQDGIRYLYEMDKAFTKASLVVHTWGDVNEVNERLKEGFKDLARTVGESSTTIATSFYRFGTLGIESSKAWLGAQASIKQAIATMGDIDTITRTNALAISLLGDTLGDYLPLEERLNFFTAKQVVLWRRNLMEANEFAGALERFLPTAKTLNLTLDQTLVLLATLHSGGLRASKAGRLLGTMFLKLVDNLGKVGRELGIVVKRGEDTFTVLRKVLRAFYAEWKKTGGHLSYELNRLFKQIFGGVRSQQVARALTVMHEVLEKNIDLINAEGIPTAEKVRRIMEEYEKQLGKVVDSYHKVMDVHKELKRQLGEELVKAFQQVITGSENHEEAIKRLNAFYEVLLKTVKFMEKHSTELNAIFIALGIRSIPVIVKGIGSLSTRFKIISRLIGLFKFNLKGLIPALTNPWTAGAVAIAGFIYALNKVSRRIDEIKRKERTFIEISESATRAIVAAIESSKEIKTPEDLEKFRKELERTQKALDEYKKFAEKGRKPEYFAELPQLYRKLGQLRRIYRKMEEELKKGEIKAEIKISPDLREQLNLLDKSVKYIRMQALGYNPIIIAQEKLNDYIDEMVGEYNEIIRKSKEKLEYVTREQVLTLLASKNYTKIKELLNLTEKDEKKILKARQLQLDILKQQMNLIKSYSSQLRSTFQSALAEFLKTQDVDKFFDNIRNKFSSLYYESVSKYITSVLESSTGIFEKLGTFFAGLEFKGTMGEPILRASEIGSQRYYSAIVEASEVGSKLIEASASKMRDPFVPPLEYIKAMEGNKKATEEVAKKMRDPFVPPPEYIRIMEGNKKATEELSREIKKSTTIAKTKVSAIGFGGREMTLPSWFPFSMRLNRLATARPHLFNLGVGALATGVMTGNWQGALTSFIGSALMTVNPFLGLGFMLVSSLFRRKRITRTTSWTNPQQAKNLLPYLGISPAPVPTSTYAMPGSYYFVSNVTVHVDKVQGERPDIVNEIAKNVTNAMEEKVAQNYYHSLLRSVRPKTVGF